MNNPIGIFDSGIGGLTVVKAVITQLPEEDIIYLGDTARVPYGTRGKETITAFALEMVRFLLAKNVKCLVIACNTISATCFSEIQKLSPVPVIGVITPAVNEILKISKKKHVCVIGTPATIRSNIYAKEIMERDSDFHVTSIACPLFVPISEEGLAESEIARMAAQLYLGNLPAVDTLHLGCTHYPLLTETIRKVVGEDITIIDSALPTAHALKELLDKNSLTNEQGKGNKVFYVTDAPERVEKIANLFLGLDEGIGIQHANLHAI